MFAISIDQIKTFASGKICFPTIFVEKRKYIPWLRPHKTANIATERPNGKCDHMTQFEVFVICLFFMGARNKWVRIIVLSIAEIISMLNGRISEKWSWI